VTVGVLDDPREPGSVGSSGDDRVHGSATSVNPAAQSPIGTLENPTAAASSSPRFRGR
jgi:hypothetical protein